jgi:pyruvate, water dikinase
MSDLIVTLADAQQESSFGGKAVSLGAAIRAGLPVPTGAALGTLFVDRAVAGDVAAIERLLASSHVPDSRLAVRSSAVGEDSSGASFAGQHATKLNVRKPQLLEALRVVWESARTPSALAYRERKGLPRDPRIGVVVQVLIEPIAAGVLFTRNPLTGAAEHVIEAAWGLGEAVVNGSVVPDHIRLDAGGRVLEVVPGDKDIKIWYGEGEGTVEVPVEPELRQVPCLSDGDLAALHDLAQRCCANWGPHLDLEWALGGDGAMYLLQCRPITTLRSMSA